MMIPIGRSTTAKIKIMTRCLWAVLVISAVAVAMVGKVIGAVMCLM